MTGIQIVRGRSLPETWDKAVRLVGNLGNPIATQYDREGDPLSRDCPMVMEVSEPLAEPRIHGFFPGGPLDLEEYCMEMIEGNKDHWVGEPPLWGYSYHSRLEEQIPLVVKALQAHGYTRRAQASMWRVPEDNLRDDPPCLQRMWFRIIGDSLHLHTHWRSRDALKACFMDMFVMIRWGELIAQELAIPFGRYVDVSDSFHIYGKDLADYQNRFLSCKRRYHYRGDWDKMMLEAREEITAKIKRRDER